MFLKRKDTTRDDVSLWNDFLNGDDDSFSFLYDKYSKKMYLQGLQFSTDKEFIKDCIHDVFVKIYQNRKSLKTVQNLRVYLFISLRNTISTQLKKNIAWVQEINEDVSTTANENTIEDDFISDEINANKALLIQSVLSTLTDRQKEVIHYRFVEGLSIQEICMIMNVNYQSVQNLLQRSIKKIRVSFEKKGKR